MVSEKAFSAEAADVQPLEVSPEHIGEDGETIASDLEVHESAGVAEASTEDEDETVDLAAVLGGNIRKAPAAATEPEAEPEAISAHAAV
jgi:small subunit ribosomal protein S2